MDTKQIREAAALVRKAWCKEKYIKDGAVSTMGAITKVHNPLLKEHQCVDFWELHAITALRFGFRMTSSLNVEACAIFDALPEKSASQKRVLDRVLRENHEKGILIKVWLADLTVFSSGEDAAAFLERVADRHERA